ncbi:unnamed protein product [Protopolystoma xenopodis]|uniref:Uncharacterized protein n=1 Tax=Protopolystoma xenopodis TaxID=117903 RepID=A0A448WWZ0_9PLAT|nr:unnamed protein product [Protopolystoma xenopodis]
MLKTCIGLTLPQEKGSSKDEDGFNHNPLSDEAVFSVIIAASQSSNKNTRAGNETASAKRLLATLEVCKTQVVIINTPIIHFVTLFLNDFLENLISE